MSNTSFSKISELMMPGRAAESRPLKSGSGDSQASGDAVRRFEKLLQTATTQRPHRPDPQRSTPTDRLDRRDRADSPDKPAGSDRRADDGIRVDDRTPTDDPDRAVTDDRPVDRHGDDRVRKDTEHATSDDVDKVDAEFEETSQSTEVERVSIATDEAAVTELGAAEGAEPEASTADVAGSEEIVTDEQAVVTTTPEVELELADDPNEIAESATVESEDVENETGAINNAAAAQAAAALAATEAEVEEISADNVESVQTAVENETDAALEPETAVQLRSASGDGEATEVADNTATEGDDADGSGFGGEGQPEQQQADGDDGAETAPAAAPVQPATVHGTAQTNPTTNPIGGLAEASAIGEIGLTSANQVAGTAPSEQADGPDPLWRQVRRAMGSIRSLPTGEQQLTIRLRPDDLGSVTIRISTGDAGTTVALVADSAAAASQLNQQRQQLIRELEEGGLQGVAVDVGTSGDTQQSPDDPEADVDQRDGTAGGVNANGSSSGNGPVRAYSGRRDGRMTEGLIDVDL